MMHLVAMNSVVSAPAGQGSVVRCVNAVVSFFGGAWTGSKRSSKRHMRLIETLPLGAKKQLLLVSCDGERFLIGTGADSVFSILRVHAGAVEELHVAAAKETL